MTCAEAVKTIRPGRYTRFKGNAHEAIGIARRSETGEPQGACRALYGEGGLPPGSEVRRAVAGRAA